MASQLLLAYDFPPMGGGISRWMGELAKRFPAGSLVVSTGQYGDDVSADRTFPNRIDRLTIPSRRLRTVQGTVLWSRRATALARSERAEFLWCGNLKPAAYPALWTRRHTGTPYGVLLHGGDLLILRHQMQRSTVKRRVAAVLLDSAALLVTNSKWTAELCRAVLQEAGLEIPPERLRSVPLGTDPQLFKPQVPSDQIRNRYGLLGRRWLLSVARLTHHKGVDLVIRALARLKGRYPRLGYIVVGSGEELPRLQSLAGELGVADRVLFLTDVSDDDLPAIYNSAELYLGLSRQLDERVEGFGISLLEAGASGIPAVAARTGGIPEAVHDGETGLLVNPEDPAEVDKAIMTLLDDPPLARRLGASARQAVASYYNWDRVTAELAQLGHEYGRSGR
jgi:phosphatidylinositol alpha-1,6-mannosyltransferase